MRRVWQLCNRGVRHGTSSAVIAVSND